MSNTFTIDISQLSSCIAFLLKRGKIHVKNTEKSTFFILKDDSILRTALSESPITSLKFEHSQTKEQKRRSDWCEIHTLNDVIGASNIPLSKR